jgi:hypothetical protein
MRRVIAVCAVLIAGLSPAMARHVAKAQQSITCDDRLCHSAAQATQVPAYRARQRAALRQPLARERAPVNASVGREGLAAELAAKVQEIAGACPGFRLISGCRPGAKIAGTNHASLHASCRAADIAGGAWACAYARLADWPGGYSVDPGAVGHIHISFSHPGGQEWGAHFRHGGGSVRFARRHHVRFGG